MIVMLSRSEDGHGGEHFYRQMAEEPDIEKTRKMFLSRSRGRNGAGSVADADFYSCAAKSIGYFCV